MKKVFALVLALAMILTCVSALADYPDKQITIVCPYGAGGASDTTARIYGAKLQEEAGVPVVVDNRTGSGGTVGMTYGAQAAADGYTITYIPVESVMNKFLGNGEVTGLDFKMVGRAMTIPAAITVRADSELNSFEDFLAYAKENPGELTVGNSGAGSIWHVAAAVVEDVCGVDLEPIPYPDGAASAIAGLLGGEIDAVSCSAAEVSSYVADGQLKCLVVLGDTRCSADILKDVPTAAELGYDINVVGWGGFGVPKDTDDAIVAKLADMSAVAIASQDLIDLLASKGFEHAYLNAEDANAFVKAQQDYYEQLIPTLAID